MRKFKFVVDTGFTGCVHEEVHELDDDVTDDELEEYMNDIIFNYVHGDYIEISD